MDLEDGEIDETDQIYVPLERPSNYGESARFPPLKQVDVSESEASDASSSDSDSDGCKTKRKKVKLRRPLKPVRVTQKKKFDVWSTRPDEAIAQALTNCDVSHLDRSRNVESYNYKLSENYRKRNVKDESGEDDDDEEEEEEPKSKTDSFSDILDEYKNFKTKKEEQKHGRTNNKRSRDDRKNRNLRPIKRKEERTKGSKRIIQDLKHGEMTDEEFAVDVANKLCEEKEELIVKIVTIIGRERVTSLYNEVKRIEKDGGMMTLNQHRRRTPGGVFLFLLRHSDDLKKSERDIIFEDERVKTKEYLKEKKKKKMASMRSKLGFVKPSLPTRAELEEKLSAQREVKEGVQEEVVNPPPTPETDGHADSGDGMDDLKNSYGDDFLDLNAGNDMDVF